jgi:hypothetical protein
MAAVYDQDRDVPLNFEEGVPVWCGRLAGALQLALENPGEPIVRKVCEKILADYDAWFTAVKASNAQALTDTNVMFERAFGRKPNGGVH